MRKINNGITTVTEDSVTVVIFLLTMLYVQHGPVTIIMEYLTVAHLSVRSNMQVMLTVGMRSAKEPIGI
jgi:hypothetical protein